MNIKNVIPKNTFNYDQKIEGIQERVKDIGTPIIQLNSSGEGAFWAVVCLFYKGYSSLKIERIIKDYLEISKDIVWDSSGDTTKKVRSFYDGVIIDEEIENTIKAFQNTQTRSIELLRPAEPLKSDGQIGPKTWAKLFTKNSDTSTDFFDIKHSTNSLTEFRKEIVKLAILEYGKNIIETPLGSNYHPEIDKYLSERYKSRPPGEDRPPWCCFFVTWLLLRVGVATRLEGSTNRFWKSIKGNGERIISSEFDNSVSFDYVEKGIVLMPGDIFIMQYRNRQGSFTGKGHVGVVIGTFEDKSKDKVYYYTIEGNSNNRLNVCVRDSDHKDIVGGLSVDDSGFFTHQIDSIGFTIDGKDPTTR